MEHTAHKPIFIIDESAVEHVLFLRSLESQIFERPIEFAHAIRRYKGGYVANEAVPFGPITKHQFEIIHRHGVDNTLEHFFTGSGDSRNRYDRSLEYDSDTEAIIDADEQIIASRAALRRNTSRRTNVGGKLVLDEHPEAVNAREIIRHRALALVIDLAVRNGIEATSSQQENFKHAI